MTTDLRLPTHKIVHPDKDRFLAEENPFEDMIKLDYLYVTNWTLRGDVVLLLRTIRPVLSRRGAN